MSARMLRPNPSMYVDETDEDDDEEKNEMKKEEERTEDEQIPERIERPQVNRRAIN